MAISETTGQNMPASAQDPEALQLAMEAYRAKSGRPSKFTTDIAAEIIIRIADGESLRAICRDTLMPSNPTVYDWMDLSPAFSSAVAQARKRSATSLVYAGVDILDGMATMKDLDGKAITPAMAEVRLAEARANYRMNLAKILDREAYGEKQQQGISCGDITLVFDMSASQPRAIEAEVVTETVTEKTDCAITYEIPGS
jgi:hypothetical protein